MNTHLTRPRAVLAVMLIAAVAAVGAYAFTASNTVPDSNAGSGTSTVSGYTATNIEYTLNADPLKVDTITFDLDAAANTVKVETDGSTWFDCSATAGGSNTVTCDYSSSPITLAGITTLNVIATQN
jgi:hypothetical protein